MTYSSTNSFDPDFDDGFFDLEPEREKKNKEKLEKKPGKNHRPKLTSKSHNRKPRHRYPRRRKSR